MGTNAKSEPDRFRIDETLGHGAFGSVYRGYDTVLRRAVALKRPHDADKARALRNEARLMARLRELNEPHVVCLYDLHRLDDSDVLVMEFVEGTTLRTRIGPIGGQQPLPLDEALDIAIQTCQGLAALHNAFREDGVFHRDIKPENLLLRSSDGIVKIADFGISRVLDQSGYASTTVGTLPYMAPETLTAQADYRADIYGLGVVLYEMTTGRLPYLPYDAAGKPKPTIPFGEEICRGEAPPPAQIAGVPEEISEIIMRAMACTRERRYQQAQELQEALLTMHTRRLGLVAVEQAREAGSADATEAALEEAARQFPIAESFLALGQFYMKTMQQERALTALRKGMAVLATPSALDVQLAMLYHTVGRRREALDVLLTAKAAEPPPGLRRMIDGLLRAWQKKGPGT